MSDIIDRIRSVETTPLDGTEAWVELWEVLQDARAEIARLRLAIRRLAEQDATLSLLCKRDGSQVVTVTMDATLTDAEREAVRTAADAYAVRGSADGRESVNAATLRGLLERRGGGE